MKKIFRFNKEKWEGIPAFNIYLLRILFTLMFLALGKDAWIHIFHQSEAWMPTDAVAWSVWASYSVLSVFGIVNPLKMMPILFLEVLYKIIWLILVAYPLWSHEELVGSASEEMTYAFLWVLLPIVAIPWKYSFSKYVLQLARS
jgi:hypothetical protein